MTHFLHAEAHAQLKRRTTCKIHGVSLQISHEYMWGIKIEYIYTHTFASTCSWTIYHRWAIYIPTRVERQVIPISAKNFTFEYKNRMLLIYIPIRLII